MFSNLFRKTKFSVPDFSDVRSDMHSHLLPGIDDGAKTMEDSIELISALKGFGYKKLITTPHIMSDVYRNTPEIIRSKLGEVRQAIAERGIEIEIDAAAEYYHDQGFTDSIGKEELLTLGDKYVLFEISYVNPPDNLRDTIFKLIVNGYKPILAHPERYPFWWKNFEEYEKLRESGVYLQVNLNSLCGYYTPGAREVAERLIDAGLVEFVGTDLHGSRHLEGLARTGGMKSLSKLISSGKLLNKVL